MTVVGIARVRNEQDVILSVVDHMLDECDTVIVADNNSTDTTLEILFKLQAWESRLILVNEPSFGFNQTETMNWLANMVPADWIVPFDADEWWDAPGGISEALMALPSDVVATMAQMHDMVPQPGDPDGDPFLSITMTRPGSLWAGIGKVAFRPGQGRVLDRGNHRLVDTGAVPGPLRIRHYPFRTKEQARAKLQHGSKSVAAHESDPTIGWHWRKWGSLSDVEFDDWWAEWTKPEGLVRWM